MEVYSEPNKLSPTTKKSAAATRTQSFTRKDIVEEIHADPMDSPLTKMLEGVLGTLDHHGDFDVVLHTDSEGQTLNHSMMDHPIVSAYEAGKVITDVNPGSQEDPSNLSGN